MASMSKQDVAKARQILEAHYGRRYQLNSYNEEWRNLSELPSSEEIMPKKQPDIDQPVEGRSRSESPEKWDDYQREPVYDLRLPKNIIEGSWGSKMDYVGSHYQLLREDAIAALRRSVGEVHRKPDMIDDNDTCIYTHVSQVKQQSYIMLTISF